MRLLLLNSFGISCSSAWSSSSWVIGTGTPLVSGPLVLSGWFSVVPVFAVAPALTVPHFSEGCVGTSFATPLVTGPLVVSERDILPDVVSNSVDVLALFGAGICCVSCGISLYLWHCS